MPKTTSKSNTKKEKATKVAKSKKVNIFKILTFVLGGALILGAGYFVYTKMSVDNTVTVTGKASADIENKIATFSATVEKSDEDKQTAVKEASEMANEIVTDLKEFGVDSKDLETTNFNVYQRDEPVYEGGYTKYEPGNWYATYTVSVTLRDLDQSAALTNILASYDDTQLWGPNLRIDDTNVDEEALLSAAIEDAREKASAMAMKSGRKLGKVLSVNEGGSSQTYRDGMKMEAIGMGGGDFPVEGGSTKTTKVVTVTFKLR